MQTCTKILFPGSKLSQKYEPVGPVGEYTAIRRHHRPHRLLPRLIVRPNIYNHVFAPVFDAWFEAGAGPRTFFLFVEPVIGIESEVGASNVEVSRGPQLAANDDSLQIVP